MTLARGFKSGALLSTLRTHLPELRGPMRVERVGGGQSNPNFYVSCSKGPPMVLRTQTSGQLSKSAHAVDREYRVFGLFRFAVILEGISARSLSGNAAGNDAAAVSALSSRFARYAARIVASEG